MEEKVAHHTDWILIALLIASFLIVFARLYHPKKFQFFRSLPFNRGVKTFESEFNPNGARDAFDVLLTLNFYLVYTMGCLLVLPVQMELYTFARILFIIVLFFLSKNFLALLTGWLFMQQEQLAVVQNTGLAYRSWSAVWLLPLVVIITFTPGLRESGHYLVLFFMLSGYLLALLISTLRLWDLHSGTNYKILYLCALEIIPFSFLIYWLKSL
ncbi:MAG: DUF4271 domain-containing protein [Owenweeksia sp.]